LLEILEKPFPYVDEYLTRILREYPIDTKSLVTAARSIRPLYPLPASSAAGERMLDPDNLLSVQFAKIIEATFGQEHANGWNPLLEVAIRMALDRSLTLTELQETLSTRLRSGEHNQNGFHPILGTTTSMQGMNADGSLQNILILARRLQVPLRVRLFWREGQFANQIGSLEWNPQ
jgi:hypothetical protein